MNWIEDDKPQSTSPDWIETFNAPILTKSTYTPEICEHICVPDARAARLWMGNPRKPRAYGIVT